MPLAAFDPLVAEWFQTRLGAPTEPQLRGWPEIAAGHNTLISAPTGSGKTLAAFLFAIDRMVRQARCGVLPDETQIVYVSPLKALSNDVQKNLELPLLQISELAAQHCITLAPIRTALRTGDTPTSERTKMARKPPHILVTTPESLYILLTAESSRKMLCRTSTVIVDEIHAIAGDKRGSHLALTLARFDALTGKPTQRIGLSATVKPIEAVADFLAPNTRIIHVGHMRPMDLAIEVPRDELSAIASNELWSEVYDAIAAQIRAHNTTLVFVNARRMAERAAHALSARLGENSVLPHHGSLARPLRMEAEARLKAGDLKAVVATASLELGIDIGSVDIVCQIGTPRSIATGLQRFGRAGHWVGAIPKARIYPTTRDELIECAALLSAIKKGELEELEIPENPLDILAQQMVAACAVEEWKEEALYKLACSCYPFRNLPREDYEAIVTMLSDGIATARGRSGALLHRDQVNGILRGRRGARLAAITSGGAIPENANYAVIVEPEGRNIGTLDEDYAIESSAGDIFLLGTHSWRIKRVENGRVRVEDAHGAPPNVPFWLGEGPGRSKELSAEVSLLRQAILHDPQAARQLLDEAGAKQAAAYVRAGAAELSALPSSTTVIAERFFDEAGGMQLVLHAPFGSRITRAWGLALRKRFCRTFNFELQAAATDNGLVLSLSDQHAFPLELVFDFLKPESVEYVLSQALLDAPVFGARWRWNATRALAVPRFRGGGRVPMPIQRMRSDDLLAAVFPDQVACAENLSGPIVIPDHPLVKETMRNCLHEAMDLNGLIDILKKMESGEIRKAAIDTSQASPFSHEILNANPYAFLDDAPLEERRTRAVQLRRSLGVDITGGAGILDPAAIATISADAWPDARDADEVHDALLTLITIPANPQWQCFYEQLCATGRASIITRSGELFWAATERLQQVNDVVATLRGWMECLGPITANELATRLCFEVSAVEAALLQLENEGQLLRGQFHMPATTQQQWCNRRILARIHRATIGTLRREIEPVTSLQLARFLERWQHVQPGSQLHGIDGALQIIRQLQGYEVAAGIWESDVLPRRIANYEPALLDQLCLGGEVMWGRISPHPAYEDSRRVRPTRLAPMAMFLRDDAAWLMGAESKIDPELLTHCARDVLAALNANGASFFQELTRISGRLPSEVEDGLWELVAGGLVTADGFDNLRALIDPRRRGEKHGGSKRPRHAGGRWALVRSPNGGLTAEKRTEHFAKQLLLRWGVLFRDLLKRETITPPWRDLLPVLRRMEAQGEIRGGRFVDGYSGEQFARPEALDLLRTMRRLDVTTLNPPSRPLSNSDPLNLSGVILPRDTAKAISHTQAVS